MGEAHRLAGLPPPTYYERIGNYSFRKCGSLYGIYNNFFVTSVKFWRRPDVQRWLTHIDHRSLIYTHRMNDILWHSSTVQIFLPKSQVQLLDDFTYEHATRRNLPAAGAGGAGSRTGGGVGGMSRSSSSSSCVTYGGRSQGTSDDSPERTLAFREDICPELDACVQNYTDPTTGKALLSVTTGTVVVEQPDCSRMPSFYLCDPHVRRTLSAHPHHFWQHHKCGTGSTARE